MGLLSYLKEKYIYLIVLLLILVLGYIIYLVQYQGMGVPEARMYLQALTAIATLTLLYYAYFNVVARKTEEIARLELAVRPVLVWELESKGSRAFLTYKAIKHPLYDLHTVLRIEGKTLEIDEKHLDIDGGAGMERKRDITEFMSGTLSGNEKQKLQITFSFHSEIGGKYVFEFTKKVAKRKKGFDFRHRKIVSAKYPWRKEKVDFSD